MVTRVTDNNCDQRLLANGGIADRHDPAWFFAYGSCRGSHARPSLTDYSGSPQAFNCVFYDGVAIVMAPA
jgi:hypothetical protein